MTIEPRYPTDYDGTLDITHIEKHNWKSTESRDRWRGPLDACRDAYPLVELLAVASDGSDRELAIIDRGTLREDHVVNLIANNGLKTNVEHNEAFIYDDPDKLEEAKKAHEAGDHETLGRLFGYPECCVEAFEDVDDVTRPPIYEIACNSGNVEEFPDDQTLLLEQPSAINNIIWQYLGYQFISHIPCSFDCEETEEIGKLHGELYRELDLGEEAEDLWEFLSTPTTWSGFHGLSNIRNGYLIGSTNVPDYWDEKVVVWGEEHADKLLG